MRLVGGARVAEAAPDGSRPATRLARTRRAPLMAGRPDEHLGVLYPPPGCDHANVGRYGDGGIFAYLFLPVAALPRTEFPVINVSASLPGASPDTMANAVATPLIKQFSTIAGIDTISATSAQGSTSVAIQFNLNRDIDSAAADVQSAIARRATPAAQ